jgi:hypothetical protein
MDKVPIAPTEPGHEGAQVNGATVQFLIIEGFERRQSS